LKNHFHFFCSFPEQKTAEEQKGKNECQISENKCLKLLNPFPAVKILELRPVAE
jgi:hypothetical protein